MWNSGAAASVTSSCSTSRLCIALTLFHQRFECVSIAPFARPVVPEVYMMMATSSGSTRTASTMGVAV